MPLSAYLILVVVMMMFDRTAAYSQTMYGVPVEAPTRGGAEPRTTPAGQMGGPEIPRGSAGGTAIYFTPNVTITERYDSNIYQAPGQQISDYVTRISPGARIQYENDMMVSSFLGSVFADLYARNPGLNYVGTNGTLQADLSNMIGRMVRGVTFRIADSFMYTPQMPDFAAPQSGNELPSEFVRGIQTVRQNALTNGVSIQSMYAMTPRISANVSYSYSILRFFNDPNAGQAGTALLFNTTSQSLTGGPRYSLSPNNTVGVSGQFQHFVMEPQSQTGAASSTATSSTVSNTIYGAAINWHSSPAPSLQFNFDPGLSFTNGSNTIWTVRAQVLWAPGSTTMQASYTRGVYPLYYLTSGVSVSNVAGASVSQNLSENWTISANGVYAVNQQIAEGAASSSNFNSTSYGGGLTLVYHFDPTFTLQGAVTHTKFQYHSGGATIGYPRDVAMLTLRKEWR